MFWPDFPVAQFGKTVQISSIALVYLFTGKNFQSVFKIILKSEKVFDSYTEMKS